MKKKFFSSLFILFFVSMLFAQRSYATQELPVPEPSAIYEDNLEPSIFIEKGYPSFLVEQVMDNFNKVPLKIRKKYIEDGWSINFGIRIYHKINYTVSVKAYTDILNKQIWIDNRDICVESILHEMGHFVEHSLGNPEFTNSFHSIYISEVSNFRNFHPTNAHNTSCEIEYFAEAFLVYIQSPDLLQEYCPNTYTFIYNCVLLFE